jgi:aquaporin Z
MKSSPDPEPSLTSAQRKASRLPAYGCELAGTTLVTLNAFSWACWNFGAGSPIVQWLPQPSLRVMLQAVCVAVGVIAVTYSPLGKRAGGLLNPSMTWGFWLLNKISARDARVYVLMQFSGAFLATFLVWSLFPDLAHSIHGGVTLLGPGISPSIGFGLEFGMSLVMMLVILTVVNSRWMRWTSVIASTVYVLFYINTVSITGTSLNPARSLAPAALIMLWQNQWIYWLAPPLGVSLAVLLYRQGYIGTGKSHCCKLYHTADIPCHHARCGYNNPAYVDDFSRAGRHSGRH